MFEIKICNGMLIGDEFNDLVDGAAFFSILLGSDRTLVYLVWMRALIL